MARHGGKRQPTEEGRDPTGLEAWFTQPDWPLLARTFTLTVIVVLTLTYFVLPLLTRLFSRWLYPPS
jgi:antibiotic biosynthesis monooxygenase (ABM) superfamily enzyme